MIAKIRNRNFSIVSIPFNEIKIFYDFCLNFITHVAFYSIVIPSIAYTASPHQYK